MDKTVRNKIMLPMAGFAALCSIMTAALVRSMEFGSLVPAVVHAVFLIGPLVFLLIFTHRALIRYISPKVSRVILWIYGVVFFLLQVTLVGFQYSTAAMWTAIAFFSLPALSLFAPRRILPMVLSFVAFAVLCILCATPSFFAMQMDIAHRERAQELYISETDGYFAHALPADRLYVCAAVPSNDAEVLLYKSLQAYVACHYSDQIVYHGTPDTDEVIYSEAHLAALARYYPHVPQVMVETMDTLLDLYSGRVTDYILYDDSDLDSLFVAANLCHQMNAVMVGRSIQNVAETRGWHQVFDATGWNEKQLLKSNYFDNLDNHILYMISQCDSMRLDQMWDNAIMNNAWIVYNDHNMRQFERKLSRLKRNSVCMGGVGNLTENAAVRACARYGVTFIYGQSASNLSTLSGFRLSDATLSTAVLTDGELNKVTPVEYSSDDTPKHTVCIMLSDADNIRFCSEQILETERYYDSPLRNGEMSYNCGLAGSMVDIAPVCLLEYYDKMTAADDFAYQLSSIGYTYPTRWTDKEAWAQVVATLCKYMDMSKTSVVEIMDDSAFMMGLDIPSRFDSMRRYFDTYTCHDEIDGCLFIDYTAMYAGYRGAVCWSNDKPIVSAKYSIWYDDGSPYYSPRNEIAYVAEEINHASTDKTCEDAYTFIIVHAWSGIDDNGDLVFSNASESVSNTMIFKQLQDAFGPDVEVVSTTEFVNRMRRLVRR